MKSHASLKRRKAVLQTAKAFAREGCTWAFKICPDIESTVSDERFRSRLAQLAYDATGSAQTASRISKALNHYVANNASGEDSRGPLAEAIKNLCLDAAIEELEKRGHRFVVDDEGVVVFLKSRAAAERVSASMARFLGKALHAQAHAEGMQAARMGDVSIFGLRVVCESGHQGVAVHESLVARIKDAMRRVTARSRGIAFAVRLREAASVVSWATSLLSLADDAREVVDALNEWLAAKYRVVLWKKWKLVRSRIAGLETAGVEHGRAVQLGGSHAGFWAAANSDGLKSALSYSVLRRMGFSFFLVEAAR